MADLQDLLSKGGTILVDGAWGTELSRRSQKKVACPEILNLENPPVVKQLAADYVAAGADIILTNSFGGSPFKLEAYNLKERTEELNEQAARLSREAAGDNAVVMASVGPTGKLLEPYGPVKESQMEDCFRSQIKGLLQGGADGILVETMSDLSEASCAFRAAKSEGAKAIVVTMSYEKKKTGMVTMMGVRPQQAAKALTGLGCDLLGANCGSGVDDMKQVIAELAQATSTPLWAKPNAGLPKVVEGETVFPESPDEMSAKAPSLVEAGAKAVGGCCGTNPEHIRALKARLS